MENGNGTNAEKDDAVNGSDNVSKWTSIHGRSDERLNGSDNVSEGDAKDSWKERWKNFLAIFRGLPF
ncbi:hypothetical protein KFK09_005850 [Dendrobium nobile]|uniref:Uncharacterized protein n=1 Tax=Dendrobium nobile TaxID=94219 RepID=A0A8T3C285_DENNO|nr:hypothetical protein KFK09_005850 [Dendrobium nobile]